MLLYVLVLVVDAYMLLYSACLALRLPPCAAPPGWRLEVGSS